jgi:hypothetical protein
MLEKTPHHAVAARASAAKTLADLTWPHAVEALRAQYWAAALRAQYYPQQNAQQFTGMGQLGHYPQQNAQQFAGMGQLGPLKDLEDELTLKDLEDELTQLDREPAQLELDLAYWEWIAEEEQPQHKRGRRRQTMRDLMIASTVAALAHGASCSPTRSHATPQPAGRSACSIVQAALAQAGMHLSERTIEDIWDRHKALFAAPPRP